jgi:hypothetical protein
VSRGREPGSISGRPEEGCDGSRHVPVNDSEAGAAENCLELVSMLVECVEEVDNVFMASLRLERVVLLGFDRQCAWRKRWDHQYPAYSEIFSSGHRQFCDPPSSRSLEELCSSRQ